MPMVASPSRSRSRSLPDHVPEGAHRAQMPGFIEPCHPTQHNAAPKGSGWIHEIKLDGYRVQLHVKNGRAIAYTRNGLNWTDKFAPIARAAEQLGIRQAIFDGEAIVQDKKGIADFHALRRNLSKKQSERLVYYAFDLLYRDGYDLRRVPLIERKRLLKECLLQKCLGSATDTILFAEHFGPDGDLVFQHACRMNLEGIVSKKSNSPYQSGRVESWVKLKCKKSESYPIIAFVEKLGAKPRKIASLYVGRYDGHRLLYAGKVATGYTETGARQIRERLEPLIQPNSPLAVPVKKPKATWVRPEALAEVEYSAVTENGLLRAAVFKGLRDDLDVAMHKPSPVIPRGIRIGVPRENILQLLPDAVVPPKEELSRYWRRVGKRALRYLGHRPLKLVRHTHGTTFYHMGKLPPIHEAVHQLRVQKRDGGEGVRLWVDSVDGLIGLVAMGAVELHPWAATVDDFEHADQLVFDLDPGQGIPWEFVVETAVKLRGRLEAEGFETWPKTTGGKGLHVMVPLRRKLTHDAAHGYARRLAESFAKGDRATSRPRRSPNGLESCSSIICATGEERQPSAPTRRASALAFRWRRR